MGNFWLKLRVWTKVTLFAVVLIYAIVFIAKNSSQQVPIWLWYNTAPVSSVLILGLCSFLLGIVAAILVRTTIKTARQIRELRERTRAERAERELTHMRVKAAMLRPKGEGDGAEGNSGPVE